MTPKIFLTGATGYIGGDALFEIAHAHPDWRITCLVRNRHKGTKLTQAFPFVSLVYGDLNDEATIEEAATDADIVYHFANCDHEPSARAISRGLARRQADQPGYWIHNSGALILSTETIEKGCFGVELPKVFNDWEGVNELTSQPNNAEHVNVDRIVLNAGKTHPSKIKTAIVCPPMIYGQGRGPDNERSKQIYRATEAFMKHKRAFTVGKGLNVWNQVHVKDLSKLYLLLGEAALNNGSPATWNELGYYLAENGAFVWRDVLEALATQIRKTARIEVSAIAKLEPEEANKLMPFAKYLIGTNSRGEAVRARRLLGWQPKERSLLDELPTVVESEVILLEGRTSLARSELQRSGPGQGTRSNDEFAFTAHTNTSP